MTVLSQGCLGGSPLISNAERRDWCAMARQPVSKAERKNLLAEFARGGDLIFANAEQLNKEAEILRDAGCLSRALLLHQISMEECAKLEMLGWWATTVLTGNDFDLETISRGFRSHKAKNHINAYMAKATEEELEARKRGDWKGAIAAFRKFQEKFHREVNSYKNASLYVDFESATFSSPSDVISEDIARIFGGLNQYFLQITFPYLRLLRRFIEDDGRYERVARGVMEKATALRKQPHSDPESDMKAILAYAMEILEGADC